MMTISFKDDLQDYDYTTYWNSPLIGISTLPPNMSSINWIMADGEELEEIMECIDGLIIPKRLVKYQTMTWFGDVAHQILWILQNSEVE